MAQLAMVTFGSAGDVHPMLALSRALMARGHVVRLLTNPAFALAAERAGVPFVPVGAAIDYEQTIEHPKLWHPVDGLGVMWRYLLRPALLPTQDALVALRRQQKVDLVVASPVAFGARAFNEASGLPLVSAYTAATMLRSVHAPMTLAQWRVPAWMPPVALKLAWSLLDRYKLEPLVRGPVAALRERAGLRPSEDAMSIWARWIHSPQAGVTLFPDWFAPAAPDWPTQVRQGGFVMYDGDQDAGWPPGLADFVAQGAPPVVFMPGTAMRHGAHFYAAAVQACRLLGRRGVLLGAVPEGLVPAQGADFWCGAYAPFGLLLPRAAALVHHGGIGSTAQALRAAIPQVVVPHAYDQFDNAMRVEQLGVGATCSSGRLEHLAAKLASVLQRAEVAQRCRHWATHMADSDGLGRACDIVEATLAGRPQGA